MTTPNPAAFDAFAAVYDQDFTDTVLGGMLRSRVWRILQNAFPPGSHVLELACGTGVDAEWLARRGVQVTAIDGSPEMVKVARARIASAGLQPSVTIRCQSLQALAEDGAPAELAYDGAFSNFGGLNTIAEWGALAPSLARAVRPGSRLVLIPMGPYCPWEVIWHLLHGDAATALRRLRQPAKACIGNETIPIWYPSSGAMKRALSPWFAPVRTFSLGLWLPPSYLSHFAERYPGFFQRLNRLESRTAHLSRGWGDHYVSIFSRTTTP